MYRIKSKYIFYNWDYFCLILALFYLLLETKWHLRIAKLGREKV